ncbi:MAG: hypothetical protein PVF65_00020 [Sphingomonadales bacterium]
MLSLLIARLSLFVDRLAPYAFLDLMRDKGMIPSETPLFVHRTNAEVENAALWTGLRQWFSGHDYDLIDLVMDGIAAKAARQAAQPQAEVVSLRNQARVIRRRGRAPLRAESWLAAA